MYYEKLIYAAGIILAMLSISSCTKDAAFWKVETTDIRYYTESYALRFKSEIESLDDGVTWTVGQVKREIDDIVDKYDGKVGCIVYLKTSDSVSGPWSTEETWILSLRD